MNILFLDDDLNRQKRFQSEVPHADIVSTAEQAIEQLMDNSYSFVFLDHDLGGEVFVNSEREDCGMEVVRWIVDNSPIIGRIICHSLNPAARMEMVAKLRDVGYETHDLPFLNLEFKYL